MLAQWTQSLSELTWRTASHLPTDVEAALQRARRAERAGTAARWALDTILENVTLARQRQAPLCQDTGALLFYCEVPHGSDTALITRAIQSAVRRATKAGSLRPNTIDPVNCRPLLDNIGPGAPSIHFTFVPRRISTVWLLLKGGGSENVSTQFKLPDAALQAGRDLEGARRSILAAVQQAQGNGCGPGILGVCIGGDRASGAEFAKRQLLRRLDDQANHPRLAALERRVTREARQLGIGPMGFGGKTTLLGVKIGALARHPASYFVSVAYMCWACRRLGVELDAAGRQLRFLGY